MPLHAGDETGEQDFRKGIGSVELSKGPFLLGFAQGEWLEAFFVDLVADVQEPVPPIN